MNFKNSLIILLSIVFIKELYSTYENRKNEKSLVPTQTVKTPESEVLIDGKEPAKKEIERAQIAQAIKNASEATDWVKTIEDIKKRSYKEDFELSTVITDAMNNLMMDKSLSYEIKMKHRRDLANFEHEMKKANFPERKVVGFKKELLNPAHPDGGYYLEPEFQNE